MNRAEQCDHGDLFLISILRVILFKFVVDIWGVNKSEFIADFEVNFEANFLHHWLSKQKSKKNR